MSFKFKFTIGLLLLVALGLPMLLKGPDGQPIMTLADWLPDSSGFNGYQPHISSSLDSPPLIKQPGEPDESVPLVVKFEFDAPSLGDGQLYKWQDVHGRWHFSNEKPADIQHVLVETLPDVENVMEAPVIADKKRSTIALPGGFSLGGH